MWVTFGSCSAAWESAHWPLTCHPMALGKGWHYLLCAVKGPPASQCSSAWELASPALWEIVTTREANFLRASESNTFQGRGGIAALACFCPMQPSAAHQGPTGAWKLKRRERCWRSHPATYLGARGQVL